MIWEDPCYHVHHAVLRLGSAVGSACVSLLSPQAVSTLILRQGIRSLRVSNGWRKLEEGFAFFADATNYQPSFGGNCSEDMCALQEELCLRSEACDARAYTLDVLIG